MSYKKHIVNSNLLNTITENELEQHQQTGSIHVQSFEKDNIIFMEGDPCVKTAIVLEGQIIVNRIDEDGKSMRVNTFKTGDAIGTNLLFSSHPYFPMTLISETAIKLLYIKKDLVKALCINNEEFMMAFLKNISDHTIFLGSKIKKQMNRTIRECVIHYLRDLNHSQSSRQLTLSMTKKDLADSIGISRTSLSRELAKMASDGLIEVHGKVIEVIDDDLFLTIQQ